MTSNLGSQIIQENYKIINVKNQIGIQEKVRVQLMEMLRKTIRPEFLNRIDETIVFTPLSKEAINKIVGLQFNQIVKRMAKNGVKLEITDAAIRWLSTVGYDPLFGARPVKRVLQKYVLNELSKQILGNQVNKDKPIIVDYEKEALVFKN
jgi:ATP-dependent Clp protease ATP-binding subunit ClpB